MSSSTLRINASRANGAKSRGPVTEEGRRASAANSARSTGPTTPEGKARSAQNALRDGVLAHSIVIPGESDTAFIDLLARLHDQLRPVGHIESRFVEIMAVADWRRNRLWCFETARLTNAVNQQQRAADPVADEENLRLPSTHAALAFNSLADHGRFLDSLHRAEVRLSRDYRRAHADFRQARSERLHLEKEAEKANRRKKNNRETK